uniref:Uncharacterized protein n=1 Tax=Triticum urartu TaxID=4572 RepID=A0A8R7PW99_TRIUA
MNPIFRLSTPISSMKFPGTSSAETRCVSPRSSILPFQTLQATKSQKMLPVAVGKNSAGLRSDRESNQGPSGWSRARIEGAVVLNRRRVLYAFPFPRRCIRLYGSITRGCERSVEH